LVSDAHQGWQRAVDPTPPGTGRFACACGSVAIAAVTVAGKDGFVLSIDITTG